MCHLYPLPYLSETKQLNIGEFRLVGLLFLQPNSSLKSLEREKREREREVRKRERERGRPPPPPESKGRLRGRARACSVRPVIATHTVTPSPLEAESARSEMKCRLKRHSAKMQMAAVLEAGLLLTILTTAHIAQVCFWKFSARSKNLLS